MIHESGEEQQYIVNMYIKQKNVTKYSETCFKNKGQRFFLVNSTDKKKQGFICDLRETFTTVAMKRKAYQVIDVQRLYKASICKGRSEGKRRTPKEWLFLMKWRSGESHTDP